MGFVRFLAFTGIAVACLLTAVVASGDGPWYFAWMLGTMMIVMLAAAGGVLFETQFAEKLEHENRKQEETS